jgi:hypothetical protein
MESSDIVKQLAQLLKDTDVPALINQLPHDILRKLIMHTLTIERAVQLNNVVKINNIHNPTIPSQKLADAVENMGMVVYQCATCKEVFVNYEHYMHDYMYICDNAPDCGLYQCECCWDENRVCGVCRVHVN